MSAECDKCGTDLVYTAERYPDTFCQVCELREENERLKEAYARLADRLRLATPKSLVEATEASIDLQARLSAAEEDRDGWRKQAQFEDRKRADLQARLAAAEEVVEAAKDHQTHPDAKLMRTIRQYEGGKRA